MKGKLKDLHHDVSTMLSRVTTLNWEVGEAIGSLNDLLSKKSKFDESDPIKKPLKKDPESSTKDSSNKSEKTDGKSHPPTDTPKDQRVLKVTEKIEL